MAGTVEGSLQVDVNDPFHHVERLLCKIDVLDYAGIINEHVDPAMRGLNLVDRNLNGIPVGDIHCKRQNIGATPFNQ
jgi:hypothetical protein